MEIHAEILKKDGRPQFAVIPFAEYKKICELPDDHDALRDLPAAMDATKSTYDWEADKAEFNR